MSLREKELVELIRQENPELAIRYIIKQVKKLYKGME